MGAQSHVLPLLDNLTYEYLTSVHVSGSSGSGLLDPKLIYQCLHSAKLGHIIANFTKRLDWISFSVIYYVIDPHISFLKELLFL